MSSIEKLIKLLKLGFSNKSSSRLFPKLQLIWVRYLHLRRSVFFEKKFKFYILGLNLSLKGQRIIPKITQKREIKCERTENKSLQSIYTLARLASSSSRVRRTASSNGPTIMDFMQCINFKSRLDREREMIRRKIRSSTLYRKPSFGKSSGFSIYNANGDIGKVSVISKNIKINELRDEPLRKVKSPLLISDEHEDDLSNEEKGILCIGNKYLDLTSNLIAASTISKSISTSTINLVNNESFLTEKSNELDFEKAMSQSHLSPASPSTSMSPKNTINSKTAISFNSNQETANEDIKFQTNDITNDGDERNQDILSPSENLKRKDHNKIIKKSTHFLYAVGINVGKYSDAQKTEVALDVVESLANSIITIQNRTHNTPASSNTSLKVKKSGVSSRKKSSHVKKSVSIAKNDSPKTTATRKSEKS